MTERGALWDAEVQGRDPTEAQRIASEALRNEWARVWELPVSYYRDLYAGAGLGPGELPPLDEIPRADKPALRADEAAHPPFGTHRVVGLEAAIRLGSSTGTTGAPTMIFFGPNDLEVAGVVGVRNMWRHGVRAGDRYTHSWPQGIYPTNVTGGRSYVTLGALEIAVGPPFTVDIAAEHLRLWQLLRPTAFMMTGSQLRTYEEAAAATGIDLASLLDGAILVFLEAACQFVRPRQRVETAYDVQIRNIGGASEIPGFATTDCAAHAGLHVAGDHFVVQACDPVTGREVPDGERGTLVVSAFGLDALFLRYDLQDIVMVSRGAVRVRRDRPALHPARAPRRRGRDRWADVAAARRPPRAGGDRDRRARVPTRHGRGGTTAASCRGRRRTRWPPRRCARGGARRADGGRDRPDRQPAAASFKPRRVAG